MLICKKALKNEYICKIKSLRKTKAFNAENSKQEQTFRCKKIVDSVTPIFFVLYDNKSIILVIENSLIIKKQHAKLKVVIKEKRRDFEQGANIFGKNLSHCGCRLTYILESLIPEHNRVDSKWKFFHYQGCI